MVAYNPMSYHNGSVWPHDTALAIAGLVRYATAPGAVELAHSLAQGILDAATAFSGGLPELYAVRVAPLLPTDWGDVSLKGIGLGSASINVCARGRELEVTGLPAGWRLIAS